MPAPIPTAVTDILKAGALDYRATFNKFGTQAEHAARREVRAVLKQTLLDQIEASGHTLTATQLENWYKNHLKLVLGEDGEQVAETASGGDTADGLTLRKLIGQEYREQIDELIEPAPGSIGYLAKYQSAVSQVEKGLSKAEKKRLEEELERRKRLGLSPEEQQMNAQKGFSRDVAKFIQHSAEQYGAMISVFSCTVLPNKTFRTAITSSEVLGDRLSEPAPVSTTIDECNVKEAQEYLSVFETVAMEELKQRHRFARVLAVAQAEQGDDAPIDREALLAFNEMSEENQEWLENGAPKEDPEEQSGFTCELNEEGCPIIPNPDDIDRFSNKGPVAIRIMRGIYNAAYQGETGNENASAPWLAMQNSSPDEWLNWWPETYQNGIPVVLAEPGHMKIGAVRAVIKELYRRQEAGEDGVSFIKVREEDKQAASRKKKSKGQAKGKGKRAAVQDRPEPAARARKEKEPEPAFTPRWGGKDFSDVTVNDLKNEVAEISGGDWRLEHAARIALRRRRDEPVELPNASLDVVLAEPHSVGLLRAANEKHGWQSKLAARLAPGLIPNQGLLDELFQWFTVQDPWMDAGGTQTKTAEEIYDLVWIMAQARGGYAVIAAKDKNLARKLKTISERCMYWTAMLSCYTEEEDSALFRAADPEQSAAEPTSPSAHRLKTAEGRWAYIVGLWNDPTFQELATFLKPYHEAEAQRGMCLCYRTLPKDLPVGFSDWTWPLGELSTPEKEDRWDELIRWLKVGLGLHADVEADKGGWTNMKRVLDMLNWRAVEELLLNIGLVMREGVTTRGVPKKKWTARFKQVKGLCGILLKAWMETGLKMQEGMQSPTEGATTKKNPGKETIKGGKGKRKAKDDVGDELEGPPAKRAKPQTKDAATRKGRKARK